VAISLVSGLDIGNFRHLQNVNQIEIQERKLPSEEDILERLRERLAVKVEQQIRSLPERDRRTKIDRFIPMVEALISTDDGKRDLAALCAFYLQEHKPETTVTESYDSPKPEPAETRDRPRRPRGPRSGKSRGKGRAGPRRR
jgi:hypothetical protein